MQEVKWAFEASKAVDGNNVGCYIVNKMHQQTFCFVEWKSRPLDKDKCLLLSYKSLNECSPKRIFSSHAADNVGIKKKAPVVLRDLFTFHNFQVCRALYRDFLKLILKSFMNWTICNFSKINWIFVHFLAQNYESFLPQNL